ncbi:MAG: hypothetical protein DA407_13970 [Bacteroidetes bacterium]|nr:MAG: hypothetical protein DA407_13970 [Bacteroidota bacterium]
MLRFFRLIRQRLLNDGNFKKYSAYAIGEIFLVVIGILIAVSIGEWRTEIKKEKELQGYYQGIKNDINQDKIRILTFDSLYKNAVSGIVEEIDKMQSKSYNQDSLYSNVPAWMVYVVAFTPSNSTFTEIVSSGKLQLFKNKELKSQFLNLYNNLYPEFLIRQTNNNEFLRTLRTINLMDTYRWMSILDNDHKNSTNLVLTNPKVDISHNWITDKQSDKYLMFENYLNLARAAYLNMISRFEIINAQLDELESMIDKELIIE